VDCNADVILAPEIKADGNCLNRTIFIGTLIKDCEMYEFARQDARLFGIVHVFQ
jgi:hypothetical protein